MRWHSPVYLCYNEDIYLKNNEIENKVLNMNTQELENKIQNFEFPILPQILVQVQQLSADSLSCANDLAEIILKDLTLTTKI